MHISISSILISRFILNLKQIHYMQSHGIAASFTGNMGAFLFHGSTSESLSFIDMTISFLTSDNALDDSEEDIVAETESPSNAMELAYIRESA